MIDPLKVLIGTPSIDGKVECSYAGGLLALGASHMVGNIVFLAGVSDIALARNLIANGFMGNDQYEWLVFIDSDMGFSAEDFRLLMDYPKREDIASDAQIERIKDDATLNTYGEALIVCAEYSRKVDNLDPVRFGMGFCRIHKSVFKLMYEANDDDGQPRIGQFSHKGQLYSHFFPSGPGFSQQWFGEDTGFFYLCRLIGITPRIERRTRLMHIGRKSYPYVG